MCNKRLHMTHTCCVDKCILFGSFWIYSVSAIWLKHACLLCGLCSNQTCSKQLKLVRIVFVYYRNKFSNKVVFKVNIDYIVTVTNVVLVTNIVTAAHIVTYHMYSIVGICIHQFSSYLVQVASIIVFLLLVFTYSY